MIAVPADTLAVRELQLQKLLSGVANTDRIPVVRHPFGPRISFVVGEVIDPIGSARSARFPTAVPGVFLNYFEGWRTIRGGVEFELYNSYFHLDVASADGSSDSEVLALHCDPGISSQEDSYLYKRGPHFHMSLSGCGLDRSHIALCLQNLEEVCSDFEQFSVALRDSLEMVKDEILGRIDLGLLGE